MKSFFKILIPVTVLVFFLASCGKNNGAGNMLPSDAMMVAHVNTKSIASKLPWDEIKKSNWYNDIYKDSSTAEWSKKILENPAASGIDLEEGVFIFMAKNPGGEIYSAAEGKLKNVTDFEQFNKNFASSEAATKAGDVNLLVLKDKNVVGWNKDHFIYVFNQGATHRMNNFDDSTEFQPNTPVDRSAELSAVCQKLFSLKKDSSLASNDKFSSLINTKGDVHIWQNTEAMFKSAPSMGMLGMLKLDALIKDNYSASTINFENGKIDIDQVGYLSKELADVLKKYTGSSLNMDMVKNIPSQDVVGLMVGNFKPAGLVEIMKLIGVDGMVNSYAQQIGISLDDLSKSTNGDFLVALTDLTIKQDSLEKEKPDFNYIFSVGIGDKPSLQKIIDAVKKMSSQMGQDESVNYVMNDKTLAIGNTLPFANKYLAGNSSKFDFTDKFSGHPFGFFIDIHKILTTISSMDRGSDEKRAMLTRSINMWNNVTAYGGDFKGDSYTSHADINLVNKDTNSLKQINTYLNDMYGYVQAQKNKKIDVQNLDSALTPPPIDTVKANK